ncbi:transcriptional regulator, TetR family [Melghirimyces thermohalophilus]|uniref:Transcriptional regulator, TetR family n=2 Tax=Melghirimyces thermohalophilus TaxID=1236220 RepID=A0A1G6R4Y5_9BACL|nr:transcriptional regulator, TetR family [Melghirimyces thermohalophilus]
MLLSHFQRATIHRVTFYSHYRDIPDLVNKMADEMADQLSAILQKSPGEANASTGDGEWEMTIWIHFLEHIAKQANFYRVILASKRIPIFRDRLLKLLTDMIVTWIETKERDSLMLNMGIKKDFLIWYASPALLGTSTAWLQNDMPYTPSFLAKQFSILHQRGLKKDFSN